MEIEIKTEKDVCENCGYDEFNESGGKQFCIQCGEELESAKVYEYDHNFTAGPELARLTTLQKEPQFGKAMPTSWDCFNLLLVGLVDEVEKTMLSPRADFKLTVLQLWAAYLRYHKKAFISKEEATLPQLDAIIRPIDYHLYNIAPRKKKRRQLKRKQLNITQRDEKRSQLRIKKEKDQEVLVNHVSQNTSTFLNYTNITSHSVKMPVVYTERGKEKLKRIMSEDHIKVHEENHNEDCHIIQKKYLLHTDFQTDQLVRTHLYCLIYMALNHIDDNTQLSDVIRYVREGHITFQNIQPHLMDLDNEQIAVSFKNRLMKGCGSFPSSQYLRHACFLLMKEIDFEFKMPDMSMLCKRYITELCLPSDIHKMIDILLYAYPPNMKVPKTKAGRIPLFEARAMAYIIFILKLLFGLDDKREHIISTSSRTLNNKIAGVCSKERQKLFVWDDWVEYINVRNNVLIQCHFPTAMKFNPNSDTMTCMYWEYLSKMIEAGLVENREKIKLFDRVQNFFQNQDKHKYDPSESSKTSFLFDASLTPKRSKIEELFEMNMYIPEFMKVNHDNCDIQSFLKPSSLKSFFRRNHIELIINRLECSDNIRFIDIFRPSYKTLQHEDARFTAYDFDISTKKWMLNMREKINEMQVENNRKIQKPKKLPKKSASVDKKNKSTTAEASVFIDMFDCFSTDEDEEMDVSLETLHLNISNFDYWMLFGALHHVTYEHFANIQKNFPKSFQFLLKECADLIETDEFELYTELLIIENYFAHCLKPFNGNDKLFKYLTNQF